MTDKVGSWNVVIDLGITDGREDSEEREVEEWKMVCD